MIRFSIFTRSWNRLAIKSKQAKPSVFSEKQSSSINQKMVSDFVGNQSKSSTNNLSDNVKISEVVKSLLNLSIVELAEVCKLCHEEISKHTGTISSPISFPSAGMMFPGPGISNQQMIHNAPQNTTHVAENTTSPPVEPAKSTSNVALTLDNLKLSIREAKEYVESVPKIIQSDISKSKAEELLDLWTQAGATVTLE